MKEAHWKIEHPELPLEEFGFLWLGKLPNTCVEAHKRHYKKLVDESNMLNMLPKPVRTSTASPPAPGPSSKAKTRRSQAPTTKKRRKTPRSR
jgi:hypothetical protein